MGIGRVALIVFSMATIFSIGLTAPIAYAMFLTPVEIIDATGDGTNILDDPIGVATDSSGNVFVADFLSDNVFKITPGGTITEIIDATGDGAGNTFFEPSGIATDSSGNVFVVGQLSDNVFKISTPGTCSTIGTPCTITEIIDATGDGAGNLQDFPTGVATDSSGNVFVVGLGTTNAFKISTPGTCKTSGGTPCTITEIIDATGDGTNTLVSPIGVATDSSGNVFVTGFSTDNTFKISTPGTCSTIGTPCTITEIIDATGDGVSPLDVAVGVATDSLGNVFVGGLASDNAFKISTPGTCSTIGTPCTITEIIDATGDGAGNALDGPNGIATDSSGNVFVAGEGFDNVFKLELDLPVGGTIIPIDTTALLVAGAQTISPWLILGVIIPVGIGLAVFTIKRSR